MDRLLRIVLSLGTFGAVANARDALYVHQRERWLVEDLAERLDRRALGAAPVRAAD
jgi:hypothetical protein